jgi:hypothetical protein
MEVRRVSGAARVSKRWSPPTCWPGFDSCELDVVEVTGQRRDGDRERQGPKRGDGVGRSGGKERKEGREGGKEGEEERKEGGREGEEGRKGGREKKEGRKEGE